MTEFEVSIITPEKIFYKGMTDQLIARTTEGDVGILAHHTSYVAALPSGELRVKINGSFKAAALAGGVLKVSAEGTTILASAVEWADEIDIDHARRSEEQARERLAAHGSGVEHEKAELKLKRAINRISVYNKYK